MSLMQPREDGAAKAAQLLIWELVLQGPLPLALLADLEAAVGGEAAPTASPDPSASPATLAQPSVSTCSTCRKTRNRFPRRTPWSSSSFQSRLSNSSISTGYVDTSSSPSGKLDGRQATSW